MFFQRIKLRYGVQVAIAMAASILLAKYFNVTNPIAAGVVTLATIQTTRKETLIVAFRRFIAFIGMLILTSIIFNLLGFNVYSYAVFMLIFISLNSYFDTTEVIVSNAVMATSFLVAGNTNFPTIKNEFIVFFVGVGIGILVNILAPVWSRNFTEEKDKLDNSFKELFDILYLRFKGIYDKDKELAYAEDEKKFKAINKFIDESIDELMEHNGNMLLSEEHYYTDYFFMRKRQIAILQKVWHDSKILNTSFEESHMVAEFIKDIYTQYHETNTNERLLAKSSELLEYYRKQELPKTRQEFETRAKLFHMLNEIIDLLMIKYDFVKGLSEETRNKYWIGG